MAATRPRHLRLRSIAIGCCASAWTITALQAAPLGPYVGSYAQGDPTGFDWSLKIEASGRFVFSMTGCTAVLDDNVGTVHVQNGRLVFSPEKPLRRSPFPMFAEALPVRWGERLYLVPADGVLSFVNQINLGDEPRGTQGGSTALRVGDWKHEVSGPPGLPPDALRLLLAHPITGKVMSTARSRAQLNLGTRKGVFVGMELITSGSRGDLCSLVVTEAWTGHSMADATCVTDHVVPGTGVSSRREGRDVAPQDTTNSTHEEVAEQ